MVSNVGVDGGGGASCPSAPATATRGMMTFFEAVQQQVSGEQGAEIVEWVLWVGGIALLAGTLYTVVSGALSNLTTNIISGMGAITGS